MFPAQAQGCQNQYVGSPVECAASTERQQQRDRTVVSVRYCTEGQARDGSFMLPVLGQFNTGNSSQLKSVQVSSLRSMLWP